MGELVIHAHLQGPKLIAHHRLAVILIKVPALNDRREDIPLLIDFFTQKIAEEQGVAITDALSVDFLEIALHDDLVGRPRWTSAVRR